MSTRSLHHTIILGAMAALLALADSQTLWAQFGPATVVATEVIQRPVAARQTFVGTVMPVRRSVVGSAVDGRVVKFLYDEQNPETKLTFVKRGQPLANLLEGTVRILRDAAYAQLALRQAEYDECSETHQDRIEQAKAAMLSAAAQQRYAQAKFERSKQLYESNRTVSLEEFELARTLATRAQQDYLNAEIAYKLAQRNDKTAQAKARLDEAQAEASRLDDRVEKYTIHAPFDGFVVAEHTEVGAWLKEGDLVAEVVQLNPAEVRAFVPEAYIARVQVGSEAVIRSDGLALAPGESGLIGRVTGLIGESASGSRTFPVKVQVDNPEYRLKSGMLAQVEMEVGERRNSLMVPKDALFLDQRLPHPRVFIVVPDAKSPTKVKAQAISVESGASLGHWIVVRPLDGTIKAGDLVVEKGNERLQPGTPLNVQREGATPPP
jgi:RND family efflux transporter MFP subunit